MSGHGRLLLSLVGLALAVQACQPQVGSAPPSLLAQAAQEATRIVQEAQATALVLQAQARATQIVAQAVDPASPTPGPTLAARVGATQQGTAAPAGAAGEKEPPAQSSTQKVEIVSVGFAADGGLIVVQFRAPKKVAQKWWQGMLYVTDEETGTTYNEIPVMPLIGPLISKPQQEGQVGNFMLVNPPPGLKKGALVTVIMGDYRFEHVPVE